MSSFFSVMLRQPRSTLFPYTTLFRSGLVLALLLLGHRLVARRQAEVGGALEDREVPGLLGEDRKSTRLNSSHMSISYAVFCLKNKTNLPGQSRTLNEFAESRNGFAAE